MDRNARLSRVLRTLAVPAYVVGGVVLLAVLIHVWDSLLGRVLLIAAIMVFGLWMWWHSWQRMRTDRHDRQKRWGIRY